MSEPAPRSLSHKLVRNTIFNSLGRTSGLLGVLLITPYVVAMLGPRMFGLWSLVLVLTGYLELLDVGLRPAFMRYVAQFHHHEDEQGINRLLTSGFVFAAGAALIVLSLTVIFIQPLLRRMNVGVDLFAAASVVIPLAVVAFGIAAVYRLLEAVIWGLQRMDVSNGVAIGVTVLQLLGTVIALQGGYGLVGLVIARGLATLAGTGFLAFGLWRLSPRLRLGYRYLRRSSLESLLRYGAKIQVTKLAELAILHGDKLFLGYFVGLPAVAFYELASRIVQGTKFLSVMITSAIVPAASELDASGDRDALRRLYRRASKYLVIAAAPLNLFPAAVAPWLVLAWLGTGYEPVVMVLQALAIGHFAHVLTASGTTIARGIGLPEVETRYALLLMVLNLSLSLAFISRLGFTGVLFATPLALILGSTYFLRTVEPLVEMRWRDLWLHVYGFPTAACLILGALTYVVAWATLTPASLMSRPEAMLIVVASGMGMCLVYGIAIWQSGYLDSYDRQLLTGLTQRLVGERAWAADISR